jgi:predicted ATPase
LRARDLCQQIGDTPQIFPALYGVWNLYYVSCKLQKARGFAEEFLDQAQRQKDRARLVAAHGMVGQVLTTLAEFDSARYHSEKLIEYWDQEKDRSLGVLYGEHPAISILGFQSWIYWFLGYPDQALERSRRALENAYDLSHANSTGFALIFTGWHHKFRREPEVVLERTDKLIALAAEQSLPFWLALAIALKGWAKAAQGEVDEGIARMQEGLAAASATGAQVFVPGLLALLAEGYQKAGQYDKGLSLITEALSTVERAGERWHETELHWLKGTLLLAGSSQNEVEAEARFRQAIAVAQGQGAKSMELRSATSLARLWSKQGKRTEACDLLAPLYGWFTEGYNTPDLMDAKALLDELS